MTPPATQRHWPAGVFAWRVYAIAATPWRGILKCAADFNGDCTVNTADFFAFVEAFFAGRP